MSKVWLAADLHLGHRGITKYRKQFVSVEEHDNVVWDNLLSTVGKRDTIFLLGDICFAPEWAVALRRLACNKILVMGNHDIKDVSCYSRVESLLGYKSCWLSHCPVHPQELDWSKKYNIHGHLHDSFINDPRYFNVSLEHINYKPILFTEVYEQLQDRN